MSAWLAAHHVTLIGVIWMVVLGAAVGNYLCSVVYRLPRGQTPFERHPFCGHCNADLQPIDLFPILSWCLTRGTCRYCRGTIPFLYTVIELACAAIFITYFLAFGMSETFLLATLYGVFVIGLAAIQWQQGWIAASIYGYALTAVALLRTLHEHSIFGWVQSGFVMLVLALLGQRMACAITRQPLRPFDTPWIWWMVLLATLTPISHWQLLLIPVGLVVIFAGAHASLRHWMVLPMSVIALYLPWVLAATTR